jgi:hypothetical protein
VVGEGVKDEEVGLEIKMRRMRRTGHDELELGWGRLVRLVRRVEWKGVMALRSGGLVHCITCIIWRLA